MSRSRGSSNPDIGKTIKLPAGLPAGLGTDINMEGMFLNLWKSYF